MNNSFSIGKAKLKREMLTGLAAKERAGEMIYLIGFMIFLFGEFMPTTMFDIPSMVLTACKGLTILIVGVKILFFSTYSKKEFWLMIFLFAISAAVLMKSGYTEAFMWLLMIFGAKGVSLRKILKVYLLISICLMILNFAASLMGVIENLQYTRENDVRILRNSFGIIYTTDFAAHIYAILMISFYLLKEKLNWIHVLMACVGVYLVYRFCDTRVDVLCMYLVIALFVILKLTEKSRKLAKNYGRSRKLASYVKWWMPFLAICMLAASTLYRDSVSVMVKMNKLLSSRLEFGRNALNQYGWTPFGQQVEMTGFGGTLKEVNYSFVDCSFLYTALRYGVIFMLVVLAVYFLCCRRYKADKYFVAMIFVIAINCSIAHHIMELAYNPIPLALFATAPFLTELTAKKVGKYENIDSLRERSSAGS